jgi:mannobiose 2-epimerase
MKIFGLAAKFLHSKWATDKVSGMARPVAGRFAASAGKTIERVLTENILSFWYPEVVDQHDEGYRLNHGLDGRWRGPANKSLVTQARTLWFFSRLMHSAYRSDEYLAAARHGYEFMRDRMWDEEFGGFYWEVDSTGHTVVKPEKRLYGQAFGLYALTEYVRAAGDPEARAVAQQLFDLIETKAHDQRHGGYRENCRRDWSVPPARRDSPVPTKRMNTHMHLLEALTVFFPMNREPIVKQRLIELLFINSNSVVRKDVGACTDQHFENWEPCRGRNFDRVSYGHDIENIWLLTEACRAVGISGALLLDLYQTIFHNTLHYGYDRTNGGFYHSGPLNGPADRREKIWWVQAEGLVAALHMYEMTGEEIYRECFLKTLGWIVNRQVDWQHGDWYESVSSDGKVTGVKTGPWKGPYHNGRAMLQCLEMLGEFESREARSEPASHLIQSETPSNTH